jgi:hypothetical protein
MFINGTFAGINISHAARYSCEVLDIHKVIRHLTILATAVLRSRNAGQAVFF